LTASIKLVKAYNLKHGL